MALAPGRVQDRPTSHVDVVPTLLAAASVDPSALAIPLAEQFSELHPFPGRNLLDDSNDRDTVYLITRDNILEGDTGGSAAARVLGLGDDPPPQMQITVPANVAANFEAIVTVLDQRWWKLVRSFDDPATWTEPFVRHVATSGADGLSHRTVPLADEWELYDLDADPIEAVNRWHDVEAELKDRMLARLDAERARCNPARHVPWQYITRRTA
jgi:arylsulfatase A-like enzyme